MSNGFKFKIKSNATDVIRTLEAWEGETIRKIRAQHQRTAINVESSAKRNAPVNLGRLRADIQHNIETTDRGVVVKANVFNTVEYAPYVEFGTKSKAKIPAELQEFATQFINPKPGTFDLLLQNISEWANRKGVPAEMVYPIAVRIARHGVRAQPYLFKAFQEVQNNHIKAIEAILNERSKR